jgi:hypothetical protein
MREADWCLDDDEDLLVALSMVLFSYDQNLFQAIARGSMCFSLPLTLQNSRRTNLEPLRIKNGGGF